MTEPIDQAMYSKEEIKALYRSLLYDFKRCKKEKNLDECSFGYETGVLITGNDAKYLIELMNQQTVWAEKLKQERSKAIDECIDAIFDKMIEVGLNKRFSYKECKTILESLKDKSHE